MNADVAIFDILGESTFKDVGLTVASKSRFVPAVVKIENRESGEAKQSLS